MKAYRLLFAILLPGTLVLSSGCLFGPAARVAELETQNRGLREQNDAQLAEVENLKVHSTNIEDQLIRAEENLALLDQRASTDRQQLANYKSEHEKLYDEVQGLARRHPVSSEVGRQLADISRRYPSLQFDPTTGMAKLDMDILFDTGRDDLKPGAEKMLREFVDVLTKPEAGELKVMVVGHTDDRSIGRRPARDNFADNFRLSTSRALAVADRMRSLGLADSRIGIAGFGAHQPIAPNVTLKDRQKNRRVEIFVLPPNVPVVGWTDSIPTVY
jgi:chemotaxis protein MotB